MMTVPKRTRDPMPRVRAADAVWEVVAQAGETGLRSSEILERQHLTRGQFENGKAHIRDYKAVDEGASFVYDGDVYVVTRDPGRCALALTIRLSSIDKQLRRLHDSICRPLGKDLDADPTLRYLDRQILAMLDNMAVMRQAGHSPTSRKLEGNAKSK